MIKVIIQGNWGPYVGTDYCYALGLYPTLLDAEHDARVFAEEIWEPDEDETFEDEGPDYWVEEYNPEEHDMLREGGGSFQDDFEWMENK